jgi:FkbM family methyltransferase
MSSITPRPIKEINTMTSIAPSGVLKSPIFRLGTVDEGVWKYVASRNEYMICDRFEAGDLVLDIGVHIGSFSFLALERGAGCVWGFEADRENFLQAAQNLSIFGDRVNLVNAAVCRSDNPPKVLYFGGYPAPHPSNPGITNTGGGSVLRSSDGRQVPAMAFDSIIHDATRGGERRVRLLKLDCEGSEFPILMTSRTLHLVDEIVGEFHAFGRGDIPLAAQVNGCSYLSGKGLCAFLEQQGFIVRWNGRSEVGGHFFAWSRHWLRRISS